MAVNEVGGLHTQICSMAARNRLWRIYIYIFIIVLIVKLLAILGEQFIVGNELCGAVVSVRPTEDIISLWNRTASDQAITTRIRCVQNAWLL